MHELIQKYPQYQTTGLEAIAFFESPVDSLQKLMENHKPPFPVVGDPKLHWYGEFGVRPSFWGLVKGFFDWKNFFKAWGLGYKPGKVEGNFAIMPADFLIDEEGRVYSAHYGKSMSDHLPLDQIENWLGSIGPAAAQFPKALPTFLKDLPYGVTKNI
jgi:peroxiredoxin Q/BCP